MELIDFAEYRRVYLPVYIKPLEGSAMRSVDFKVDTGADSSTISKEKLYELGLMSTG